MRAFPGSASRIHGYLAHHRRLKYTSLEASLHSSYFFSKKPSLLSASQLLLIYLFQARRPLASATGMNSLSPAGGATLDICSSMCYTSISSFSRFQQKSISAGSLPQVQREKCSRVHKPCHPISSPVSHPRLLR